MEAPLRLASVELSAIRPAELDGGSDKSIPKTVLVYRNELLPISETFNDGFGFKIKRNFLQIIVERC